jgi:hypothetical protein
MEAAEKHPTIEEWVILCDFKARLPWEPGCSLYLGDVKDPNRLQYKQKTENCVANIENNHFHYPGYPVGGTDNLRGFTQMGMFAGAQRRMAMLRRWQPGSITGRTNSPFPARSQSGAGRTPTEY